MAFPDIQSAVEDAYCAEREMGFPSLYGMRSPVAFFAAQKIVEGEDAALLDDCPPWLVAELYTWLDALRDQGTLVFHSSVGAADHTALGSRLAELLPPKASHGKSLELEERQERYSSGRLHRCFTRYEPANGEGYVLHGLHREYAEDGTLTETEYRHGASIGVPRRFDQAGGELA